MLKAKNDYNSNSQCSSKEFQQAANGVFQAEGCISGGIKIKGFYSYIVIWIRKDRNFVFESNKVFLSLRVYSFKNILVLGDGNKKSNVYTLKIEGVKATHDLFSLFAKYPHFWFFKAHQFNLLAEFFKYHSAGVIKYRQGLLALLNVLYKHDNNRVNDLNYYIDLANTHFNLFRFWMFIRTSKYISIKWERERIRSCNSLMCILAQHCYLMALLNLNILLTLNITWKK